MSTAAVRTALLLASLLAFWLALPAADGAARAYGRERVAEYVLSPQQVESYRAQVETAATLPMPASWVDPSRWVGPVRSVGSGRNPYTLVLTVNGVAPAPGDVRTQWHAGWEVQESPLATREVQLPLAALSRGRVEAGTELTLTAVGAPMSFRGERRAAPTLALAAAHNFEIRSMRVALWSGPVPWVWQRTLTAPRTAWLLLGLLGLAAWWMLPRHHHAGLGAAAPRQLPAAPTPNPATHAAWVAATLQEVLAPRRPAPAEGDPGRSRDPYRSWRAG